LAIACQDEKDIQQKGMLAELLPVSLAQKAVLDKGKAALNGSNPVWNKGAFVDHFLLLCLKNMGLTP
jgi:hypothetical protein